MRARARLPGRRVLAALALSSVATTAPLASAQEGEPAKEGEFSVQRFEPAPGPRNFLTVEGARMETRLGVSAGLMFNYAKRPFVVRSCASRTNCDERSALRPHDVPVVEHLSTWDLLASLSPARSLQLGLRVPFAVVDGAGFDPATGDAAPSRIDGFAMGDPTLEGKLRLVGGPHDPAVLGAAVDVAAPVGANAFEGRYVGNDSPVTVGVRGIYDGHFGPISLGLNLRGVFREEARLGSTTLGPELRYGVALGYRPADFLRLVAETFGSTRFSSKLGTSSLEAGGAIELHPLSQRDGLAVTLGGGAGVLAGVGTPAFRLIAGLSYAYEAFEPPRPVDPNADTDDDSVPDGRDRCPDAQETINGAEDDDGCPDQVPDRDKDGIWDDEDRCPSQAGLIKAGEYKGCPDSDADGVPDEVDRCIAEPAPAGASDDGDGCP